jgi:hypothetical protein
MVVGWWVVDLLTPNSLQPKHTTKELEKRRCINAG